MPEERTADSAGDGMSVVVNDEEQYSIWWRGRELPPGWRETGYHGSEDECLAHIAEVWTDMRPSSLRRTTSAGRNDT